MKKSYNDTLTLSLLLGGKTIQLFVKCREYELR